MPLLFCYGTLRQDAVQMSLFGRLVSSEPDELVGFTQSSIACDGVIHAIVKRGGSGDSRVSGLVLRVSDGELEKADRYEPPPYGRVMATLASGRRAWVYADTRT